MAGLAERLQGLHGEVDMTPHDAVLGAATGGCRGNAPGGALPRAPVRTLVEAAVTTYA